MIPFVIILNEMAQHRPGAEPENQILQLSSQRMGIGRRSIEGCLSNAGGGGLVDTFFPFLSGFPFLRPIQTPSTGNLLHLGVFNEVAAREVSAIFTFPSFSAPFPLSSSILLIQAALSPCLSLSSPGNLG